MRHNYDLMAEYIINVYNHVKHCDKQVNIFAQGLRNQIFDIGGVYTGYTSKLAISTGLPKSKLTEEHIYPRMKSTRYIIHVLSTRNISHKRLAALIKSRCRVHITTKQENMALVPHQKDEQYHWREGYKKAGIELIKKTVYW